jgi:hypothetical protein
MGVPNSIFIMNDFALSGIGGCKDNPNSIDEQLFSQYLVRGNPK